ncbi:MAG: sialidase [Planctomycetes bacterium]|nr:sialidase [Planctomycetota bacterium]
MVRSGSIGGTPTRRARRPSGAPIWFVPLFFQSFCTGAGIVESGSARAEDGRAVVRREYLYEQAPFPECHASTICETKGGLVAAWFGGTEEGHADVGVWFARRGPDGWSPPREIATGAHSDGRRYPCWNPVLVAMPSGRLTLFYKVGPSPRAWWGMVVESTDQGGTWSAARALPESILGPIKNKPVMLDDGRLLAGSSTEHAGWRVHMEWTSDEGRTWTRSNDLNPGDAPQAIQPTILRHADGALQALFRARSAGFVLESWSRDAGATWSPLGPTSLPNPNSGIDGVTLRDGRHLLVYNHTPRGRSPLNVALSTDGKAWRTAVTLESEPGEFSYPAVIQASDGRIHVTYTWKRSRVAHVELDPEQLDAPPDGR